MNVLLRLVAAGAALALVSGRPGAAATAPMPRVVDLMPAFWSAWDATGDDRGAARARALEALIAAHPEAYDPAEYAEELHDPGALAGYVDRRERDAAAVRAAGERIVAELPQQIDAVRSRLPDLALAALTVYVVPSFEHYNGRVRPMPDGSLALFLAPDGMVQGEGAHPNVAVTVSHELFHVYQFQTHPGVDPHDIPLWQAVWAEGSAVYASRVIADVSLARAAGMGEDEAADSDARRALACGIRDAAESREEHDFDLYLTGGVHPPGLPDRGGYLVGALIAQDVARAMPLERLGKLTVDKLRPQFFARLARLCASGDP